MYVHKSLIMMKKSEDKRKKVSLARYGREDWALVERDFLKKYIVCS